VANTLAGVLALALLVVAGCATPSTSSGPSSSAAGSAPGSGQPSTSDAPVSPVVGTVASVDPAANPSPAASPTKASAKPSAKASATPKPTTVPVFGFTLLATDGQTLTFTLGDLDNAADFPPSSLYDRMSTEDPIRVFFTIVGDSLVVYHIEDAG
jgi:hypothetical protein